MVGKFGVLGTRQVCKRFRQIFKKKQILKVKQSTPYVMLYGDLGCVPLSISIKKRVIGYWYDIINCDNKFILNII